MNLDGYLPAMNKGQGKRKKNTDDTRLHFIYKLYSSFSFLFLHGEEGDHQLEAYKKVLCFFVSAIHGSMVLETNVHHFARYHFLRKDYTTNLLKEDKNII